MIEMKKFCYSCGAPVEMDAFKGPIEHYCRYCVDEMGYLKSRKEIQAGIAQWLATWQPEIDQATAMTRADLYMKAMPAWA